MEKLLSRLLLLVFLLLILLTDTFSAQAPTLPLQAVSAVIGFDVPLTVRETGGVTRVDDPVTWGVPLAERFGITGGCGGNYCPNGPVTRAMMAVFVVKVRYGVSFTPPDATGKVFADVPADSFAAAYIEQLHADGVTDGCGGGNYCPTAFITRAEIAVFLVAAFNLP